MASVDLLPKNDCIAQGVDFDRLQRLLDAIQEDVDKELYDGAQLVVGRHGKILADAAIGYAERHPNRELRQDDALIVFSISKQLTVALVLNYVERGLLSFSVPVAEVLPKFGVRGKQSVTLYHLLTHTAGFGAEIPTIPIDQLADLGTFTSYVCELALEAAPGERVIYSKMAAHAVMASMVEAVDPNKRNFGEIVDQELLRPLEMFDTSLGPPKSDRYVVPMVERYRQDGAFTAQSVRFSPRLILAPGSQIPGGGFVSNARDYYKFADMLRNNGKHKDFRLLSPRMIETATRSYTGDMPNSLMAYSFGLRYWQPWPAYLGLGFFVRGEQMTPGPLPSVGSPNTFGGWGTGTSIFWVDPKAGMCFVLATVGALEDTDHLIRCQRLSDMALASIIE